MGWYSYSENNIGHWLYMQSLFTYFDVDCSYKIQCMIGDHMQNISINKNIFWWMLLSACISFTSGTCDECVIADRGRHYSSGTCLCKYLPGLVEFILQQHFVQHLQLIHICIYDSFQLALFVWLHGITGS